MLINKKVVAGLVGRIGTHTLHLLKPPARAAILEGLVGEMVTIVPVDGNEIALFAPFPGLVFRAESLLTKEVDTINWIAGFNDGAVFWDIGANVGVYSLYAAVKCRAVVLAFEPAAPNFYSLTRNVHLNSLDQRVHPYCIAFSSKTRLGVMNLESEIMGSASNQFGESGDMSQYACPNRRRTEQSMLGFSIDEFIRIFDPPFPNHLKLDVDGIELDILLGASITLSDSRLSSILVELSITRTTEKEHAFQILNQFGFRLMSQGEIQGTEPHAAANHLFYRI